MEFIIICIAVAAVSLSTASYYHRSRQRAFLKKTLKVDEPLRKRVARELGVDGAVVTGVSVFDVLYNTMKLDPQALRGMDHLHHAKDFQNLGDLIEYMKSDIIQGSEPGEAAWKSMIHKYKGYTGEETVADYYRELGHNVETPESGTAEGVDHIIDGKPYNVKVTDQPNYIREHLDKYPDIGVIAPREMADAFRDDPRVIINPNLSCQEAFHSTADTFEGIADLGDGFDLDDGIPFISALFINTVKNTQKLHKGDLDLKTAVEHTALDTTTVGAGGLIGKTVGLSVGLALVPATGAHPLLLYRL